jgi:thymidylate synthase
MRIFANCKEAIKETERDLFEMGITVHPQTMQDKIVKDNPKYKTLELSPYGFQIVEGGQKDKQEFIGYLFESAASRIISWADAEFSERILKYQRPNIPNGALNPGKAWELRADIWSEYIHNEHFAYSYAERFGEQLARAVHELQVRPESRQVIMQMYNYGLDQRHWGATARVPCSLNYQFLIRENRLSMIYTMRSNDFLTFFSTDNYMAMLMQEFVAKEVEVELGRYTFFTGSLHAYHKDMEKRGIF